jgi:hypothetical protein
LIPLKSRGLPARQREEGSGAERGEYVIAAETGTEVGE